MEIMLFGHRFSAGGQSIIWRHFFDVFCDMIALFMSKSFDWTIRNLHMQGIITGSFVFLGKINHLFNGGLTMGESQESLSLQKMNLLPE